MKVISIKHNADILMNTYQIHESVKNEVVSKLREGVPAIGKDSSNVKATVHTIWDWEPNNIVFKNLKEHISEEIDRQYKPGFIGENERRPLHCSNFWLNVYEKDDYAQVHHHLPYDYSFVYFVDSYEEHPPLVFPDSGYEVPAVEGTYVAFPAYLNHSVNKNTTDRVRITLSGNYLEDF